MPVPSEHPSTAPTSVVEAMFATPLARGLVAAIVLMTAAMVFMGGMITGALVGPARDAPLASASDAAPALPELIVTLPHGAVVLSETVDADRLLVVYQHRDGRRGAVILAAPDRPTTLVYAHAPALTTPDADTGANTGADADPAD